MKKISLTQGQFALVDDEDFERASAFKWCVMKTPYGFYAKRAYRTGGGGQVTVLLHRFIIGDQAGFEVDHINHDTLDCQKHNLRICTRAQNARNRSGAQSNSTTGLRGIVWRHDRQKFSARITIGGKAKYLGNFKTAPEAVAAYAAENIKAFAEYGGVLEPIQP